ncbi:ROTUNDIFOLIA like 7 [Striga hermonthica]|uniref:ROTUNDIFOLIA like 7 n=1 Tax=Striga hermonthica TaxID=68872 RepID=A0A9N7RE50_STRHE|nr:ROTUNDIFOLIA like 7 [Striga hermonthica]
MEYYMDEKWKVSKDDKNKMSRSKSSSSGKNHSNSYLPRSFSQKSASSSGSRPAAAGGGLPRSSSQRCSEFTRKCKEQKAKFYIVKRCISMLVGWKKHGGSDS